jgi:hypothetical protein
VVVAPLDLDVLAAVSGSGPGERRAWRAAGLAAAGLARAGGWRCVARLHGARCALSCIDDRREVVSGVERARSIRCGASSWR